MIIQPKSRGFICLTAHPTGCYKNVEDMVNAALAAPINAPGRPKNVLVLGASGGYGLASRVVAAFSCGAKTIGVSLERQPSPGKTATAGFYNNRAFDDLAKKHGLGGMSFNADAFSDDTRRSVASACRELFGARGVDMLIYSLASPRRTHPKTGETFSSVIKPIGRAYASKTVDFHTGVVKDVEIPPATQEEIAASVMVMGGEDWQMWVDYLQSEGLLAEGFTTLSYSYIGPQLTHPVYKDGTIGRAKDDLLARRAALDKALKPLRGRAYVSVNKALVTQASSAIPVVPLYISLLYKIMKDNATHEGCYAQMHRLFSRHLCALPQADGEGRIRMDDYEMRREVQDEIMRLWPKLNTENVRELTDLAGYRNEFFNLFGFNRADVDYNAQVSEL